MPITITSRPTGDGNWHHVIATWDKMGGKNNMKIFIDGVLIAQKTTPVENLTTRSSDILIGGGTGLYPDSRFKGLIDDVRIYNRALTEEQVKALHEWEKPWAEEPAGSSAHGFSHSWRALTCSSVKARL